MAKKLSTQAKLKRLRAEGYSRKELARSFGVSVSAVGRAERGQTKGETFKAQADQFFKLGKRARLNVVKGATSLPSAPAPKTQAARRVRFPVVVTPLQKAEGALKQWGDASVVVNVVYKDRSKRVFYARGGIDADTIRGDLKGALDGQADRQGYNDGLDWGNVMDIEIEEY